MRLRRGSVDKTSTLKTRLADRSLTACPGPTIQCFVLKIKVEKALDSGFRRITKSSALLQGFTNHQPLFQQPFFQHPARSIQPAAINGIEPELMIADISGGCMNI